VLIRPVVVALGAAVALTGCSSDADPRPLPPLPPPSATQAAALPVPPEAMPATPQGAAAFARYYFGALVNQAYESLDPASVQAHSTSACGSCDAIVTDVERLRDARLRVPGQRFKIGFAEAAPAEADGSIIVDFRFSSDPYVETDAGGEVVREEPAQVDVDGQAKLIRRDGGWAMEAIRTVGT
jgi:hypothetical protein